jgi:hypothetical protein
MAFTGNYLVTSFKRQLLEGVHDFSNHVFKLALYTNAASFDATTTAYTSNNEVAASGTYVAGGAALVPSVSVEGTAAVVGFSDVTLSGVSFTSRGALIYNSSLAGNPAVAVLDFGGDKVVSGGGFVVQFPPASATTALVRIL